MVDILDCRGKEILRISREGGDLSLQFYDPNYGISTHWFEMKKPYARTYEKIEKLMEELKKNLVQRE